MLISASGPVLPDSCGAQGKLWLPWKRSLNEVPVGPRWGASGHHFRAGWSGRTFCTLGRKRGAPCLSMPLLSSLPAAGCIPGGNPQGSVPGRGSPSAGCQDPQHAAPLPPAQPSSLNLSDPSCQAGQCPVCLPVWVAVRIRATSGLKGGL